MEKVMQCVKYFYAHGTMEAQLDDNNTLEGVIRCMNSEGWRVDQIVPLSFRSVLYSESKRSAPKYMDVASGILLCNKIE